MKKIIIATLVGTVIFFGWQTAMWMGGLHSAFYTHTDKQDAIMQYLSENLNEDGLYFLPSVDPAAPNAHEQEEKMMEQRMGKPWAFINYHQKMEFESSYVILGVVYTLLACLIASLIVWHGQYTSFGVRFLVSMGIACFTLFQGVLDDMNWWGYPWSFVKPEVIDLTLGWGLCSAWLAWYLKKA